MEIQLARTLTMDITGVALGLYLFAQTAYHPVVKPLPKARLVFGIGYERSELFLDYVRPELQISPRRTQNKHVFFYLRTPETLLKLQTHRAFNGLDNYSLALSGSRNVYSIGPIRLGVFIKTTLSSLAYPIWETFTSGAEITDKRAAAALGFTVGAGSNDSHYIRVGGGPAIIYRENNMRYYVQEEFVNPEPIHSRLSSDYTQLDNPAIFIEAGGLQNRWISISADAFYIRRSGKNYRQRFPDSQLTISGMLIIRPPFQTAIGRPGIFISGVYGSDRRSVFHAKNSVAIGLSFTYPR